MKDVRMNLNRTLSLKVPGLDQLMFNCLPGFVFSIIFSQLQTEMFELLSRAYYNERNDGRVVFFRDSRFRISKANFLLTL